MTRRTMEAIARLRERFGDKISVADAVRAHHASGVTAHRTSPPDAILFAGAEDVVDAVRICSTASNRRRSSGSRGSSFRWCCLIPKFMRSDCRTHKA
jgi:hypothetical protein